MRKEHIMMALAIFAVFGIVSRSQSLAEAWQGNAIAHVNGMMTNVGESLIHKVGADGFTSGYSGMSVPDTRSGGTATYSQQGSMSGDQYRQTGEYKSGSPSNEGRYGANPSDSYMKKESSGSSNGPYGGTFYGGVPTTPSADPLIKELSR
jgi:hypothetical protein